MSTNPLAMLPTTISSAYLTDLYAQYRTNRNAVDASWAQFFDALGDDVQTLTAELHGASWAPHQPANTDDPTVLPTPVPPAAKGDQKGGDKPVDKGTAPTPGAGVSKEALQAAVADASRLSMLIEAYRIRGHLLSSLDPLGLWSHPDHPDLSPQSYGFTQQDLDRPIAVNQLGFTTATINEVLNRLKELYCGTIGFEYMHIQDPTQRHWFKRQIEDEQARRIFNANEQKALYNDLVRAEGLELFLQKKYTTTKRFGLEGGESTICAIEEILRYGAANGITEVAFGMAHRGRLNVLTNVLQKSFTALFSEFQGTPNMPDSVQGSGDVKYHMGASADRELNGVKVHVSLAPNPSHLEAVNPVVVGRVRAKQAQKKDIERKAVMGIIIHGDAAFPGQGVVSETLLLSGLQGYTTGGSINIVINNQIGFTTTPEYGRFTSYPTDVAKSIQAPIIHVNGDDPEAVAYAARLAVDYRLQFKADIVIDIVCYRRHGHNESDEPAFTQPVMYQAIREKASTLTVYAESLAKRNVATVDELNAMKTTFEANLEQAFTEAATYKPTKADMLDGAWTGLALASGIERRGNTGVAKDTLKTITQVMTKVPTDFNLNSKIARQFEAKQQAVHDGVGIDWSTAEALAFGTLLNEGFGVRLTGQDVGRGTFSQRHDVVWDQNTNTRYVPLQNIKPDQGMFEIYESPLSEYAVMGFEYGYSLADPKSLVLWEAQFGDFVNGAQIMIDQFIASAETKWLRMSGLTLLLPHGFEGQGPEHSSARLERFLQLCAEDNIQVANCTTPANYFHILRRQMHRDFRKPLVIMTPKSLLRHKACVSDLTDFTPEKTFRRVIKDATKDLADGKKVKRVVLCTGKVYYDLLQARDERNIKDIALVRVEQLYPFPADALKRELTKYPNADVVWCQEEPQNQGAWTFMDRRIESVLVDMKHSTKRPRYVGRPDSASPATGSLKRHGVEQAKLIDEALAK
jgi:2-oxoglutarate dehydrogenase E1 component